MSSQPAPRSLLVVEDDPLMRELLATLLESRGFSVTSCSNAPDALRAFRVVDPDGAVIDVELGAGPNGFDLAESLRRQDPHLAILFLTNLPDARFADRDPDSLPTGISYLVKSAINSADALVDAVDGALRGVLTPEHRHDRSKGRPLGQLTDKQLQVLRLMAEGLTNQQIAEARGISVKAVEDTITRLCAALGIDHATDGNIRVTAVNRYHAALGGRPHAGTPAKP